MQIGNATKSNVIFIIFCVSILFITVILIIIFALGQDEEPYKNYANEYLETDVAIIVHTFDGYERYWEGCIYFFQKYYINQKSTVYFANEEKDLDLPIFFKQIKCGKGSWGQRLMVALNQIPENFIVYMQEDMWLTNFLHHRYLEESKRYMEDNNLLNLKLFKDCHHKFDLKEDVNNPLWYIGTHQPSLWKKEFLISTLDKHMSPFKHEISLNRRLHERKDESDRCKCVSSVKFDFYQYLFYEDVSRRGELRDVGKKMLQEENMDFFIGPNEVLIRQDF